MSGGDPLLQPAHAADAVLDLIETVVDLRGRQLDPRSEIQLVRPKRPVRAALPERDRGARLDQPDGRLALLGGDLMRRRRQV